MQVYSVNSCRSRELDRECGCLGSPTFGQQFAWRLAPTWRCEMPGMQAASVHGYWHKSTETKPQLLSRSRILFCLPSMLQRLTLGHEHLIARTCSSGRLAFLDAILEASHQLKPRFLNRSLSSSISRRSFSWLRFLVYVVFNRFPLGICFRMLGCLFNWVLHGHAFPPPN